MEYEDIVLDKKDGIATITLNRPQVLNALNVRMLSELLTAFDDIEKDDSIGAVVIIGVGRAFSAGMDLRDISARGEGEFALPPPVGKAMDNLSKPVIAAVNGLCYTGALEMVQHVDIIIASESATFADTHARYGLFHGWGGTQRLPRMVGIMRAKEMLLTCEPISAKEAERIGLVNRVVPHDRLNQAVQELARKIVANSPRSVAAIKSMVNRGMKVGLAAGEDMEVAECERFHKDKTAMQESKERLRSFSDRRKG